MSIALSLTPPSPLDNVPAGSLTVGVALVEHRFGVLCACVREAGGDGDGISCLTIDTGGCFALVYMMYQVLS